MAMDVEMYEELSQQEAMAKLKELESVGNEATAKKKPSRKRRPAMKNEPHFLGVYPNTNEAHKDEVPFRAAIRLPVEKQWETNGETVEWLNIGYFKSRVVAARAYNMYAVLYEEQNAIVNDYGTPSAKDEKEWQDFIAAKPGRIRNNKLAAAKAQELMRGGNFRFRKYAPAEVAEKVNGVF